MSSRLGRELAAEGYELVSHELAPHPWCRLGSSEFTYPG